MDDPALFMPHLEFTQNLGGSQKSFSRYGGIIDFLLFQPFVVHFFNFFVNNMFEILPII